jgi:hypothetical protein
VPAEVEVVGAEVVVGVETDCRVEEPLGKRQRARLASDGVHKALDARRPDALPVVSRRHPEVGRPDLHSELFGRKIELSAEPHPRSRTRMPARSSSTSVRASVSQSTFGPITVSITHSTSYAAERGKAAGFSFSAISCARAAASSS